MKEFTIDEKRAGQRFDKYLQKLLKEAGTGFLYKMLRKKNIVLNDKKASGKEILEAGDVIKIYLADETYDKFAGPPLRVPLKTSPKKGRRLEVIYENKDVLLLNKPRGVLSQKAKGGDYSLVEMLRDYLLASQALSPQDLQSFSPGICNRLDRNTSGLVIAGASVYGLQQMSELLRTRHVDKYYLALVHGCLKDSLTIKGFLTKDERKNLVTISETAGESYIETYYEPLAFREDLTLLKVKLITGKTHQIRAHLQSIGHGLVGDYKYGGSVRNDKYKRQYGLSAQFLHSYEVVFPELPERLSDLSRQSFQAPLPTLYKTILEDIQWQHGIPAVSEVLR
ncbi:RluA family pseudouridine synthase [Ohessyouella blattaphilus]|uniref:RNA pseudouridylate synthase n=1 Tax=Ohessyouella blattaphilus TaxID=2949333 RepID=A0ABT1EHU3_9FIRM|nr:RluA family pseudouridine synthase [Ohessyouella blattaphilus]MCP1109261.1 RluA family pseudouridine synthase [Ohessyouella blattaphilus]MCR8562655.1 RluA family pseudouridine synthase [Ohessyouella blattaphilus]